MGPCQDMVGAIGGAQCLARSTITACSACSTGTGCLMKIPVTASSTVSSRFYNFNHQTSAQCSAIIKTLLHGMVHASCLPASLVHTRLLHSLSLGLLQY